jgi:hypothetical protein
MRYLRLDRGTTKTNAAVRDLDVNRTWMRNRPPEPRPDALRQDGIIDGFLTERPAKPRSHTCGAMRHVSPDGTHGVRADVRGMRGAIPNESSSATAAIRVEQVHEPDTQPQARQHGSTILQHGSDLPCDNQNYATVVPSEAFGSPATRNGVRARRRTVRISRASCRSTLQLKPYASISAR